MNKNDCIPQEIKDNLNPDDSIDCYWVINSETGDRVLVDKQTNKEIGRWIYKCKHPNGWFDRTISLRKDGIEKMAYICVDCGDEL